MRGSVRACSTSPLTATTGTAAPPAAASLPILTPIRVLAHPPLPDAPQHQHQQQQGGSEGEEAFASPLASEVIPAGLGKSTPRSSKSKRKGAGARPRRPLHFSGKCDEYLVGAEAAAAAQEEAERRRRNGRRRSLLLAGLAVVGTLAVRTLQQQHHR